MKDPAASARIYTDFNGLAALRAKARNHSPEARREVARQFEALFLQVMLKSMRQAGAALDTGQSDQLKFYQQMFDQQIALELAGGNGIGLARVFEQQLARQETPQPRVDDLQMLARRPFVRSSGPATGSEQATTAPEPIHEKPADWPPKDPAQFLRQLWPSARKAAEKLGVAPEVLLAQAALESGWGRRVPGGEQGSSFNLFGIKADGRWQGDKVSQSTLEYRDGVAVRERAAFRSYRSPHESMEDYAAFIRENPRYRQALQQAAHPLRYLQELQKAGYATDPAYANKVGRILSSEVFATTLAELKSG